MTLKIDPIDVKDRLDIIYPVVTSVAEQETKETDEIIKLIDEALFYEGLTPSTLPLAKPREVLAVLIQLLVSKNLITLQEVRRILDLKKED